MRWGEVGRVAVVSTLVLVLGACATTPQADRPERRSTLQKQPADEAAVSPKGAKGPTSTGWRVTRIVDGDTVDVSRGGRTLTLRLIGLDTPETVHPTEPIECFGPQATQFATQRLLGKPAALEFDRSQGRLDYYGRTLAYLWITRGSPRQFNLDALRRGYALEYTYDDPYLWQREFQRAEALARSARLGVWRCQRPGS